MTDEVYREVRVYQGKGLCDERGVLLTARQLRILADLATSQYNYLAALDEVCGVRTADGDNDAPAS